jgi:hypothetical protein
MTISVPKRSPGASRAHVDQLIVCLIALRLGEDVNRKIAPDLTDR